MSNIYRLIIYLPLFILGCSPDVIDENKVIQKIDSLAMTIYSKSGDKIYSYLNYPFFVLLYFHQLHLGHSQA